jgi:diguanylate cyclase (GGDEF)-like protein
MGILMDQSFLSQLEKPSELHLRLLLLAAPQPVPAPSTTASYTEPADLMEISPQTRPLDSQRLQGKIHLLNRDRHPIQTLLVEAPRPEYQEGETTLNQLTLVLFFVGFSLSIVISLLLDRALRNQQLLKVSEAALQAANQELQQLVNFDGLTQIANRRCFQSRFQQEWEHALRDQFPITLILCDVDFFKSYNDTYGHQAGDRCLQQIAQAISHAVKRTVDCVARYGGEEFAVLLVNTDLDGGIHVANAIAQEVQQLQIPHIGSTTHPHITLSLGVASVIPNSAIVLESLIEQSDQNLYRAKQQGRNQVVSCGKE